jgi:hypothetical protein
LRLLAVSTLLCYQNWSVHKSRRYFSKCSSPSKTPIVLMSHENVMLIWWVPLPILDHLCGSNIKHFQYIGIVHSKLIFFSAKTTKIESYFGTRNKYWNNTCMICNISCLSWCTTCLVTPYPFVHEHPLLSFEFYTFCTLKCT